MTGDASIQMDKVSAILIGGDWHDVTKGSLTAVTFDLDPDHPVPGIGFQTGPDYSRHDREAMYAPLSAVVAVKTHDDSRVSPTQST